MPEPLPILAGDCTVTDEDGDETRQERGNTISIIKPDNCRELLVERVSTGSRNRSVTLTPDLSSGRTFSEV